MWNIVLGGASGNMGRADGYVADADEQPRSGGRGEAGGADRPCWFGQGRPKLGML